MIAFILLIAHFTADFTFQSAELAQKKLANMKYLMLHGLIYAAICLIILFPMVRFKSAILPYIIIITSHFLIDWGRNFIDKKYREKSIVFASFIVDQALHVLIIIMIVYAFNLNLGTTSLYSYIAHWTHFKRLIIYSLVLVIIWDPAAVFIKKLLIYIIEEDNNNKEENDPKAGRMIGKLERLIISVLVMCNQFGAVGFVLTAKSIARYKQLEDKNFAEKYLVGTLTSASIAFITTIIFMKLMS